MNELALFGGLRKAAHEGNRERECTVDRALWNHPENVDDASGGVASVGVACTKRGKLSL